MIESSDLNDGQILTSTTQRRDARDFIQFHYILPSGRKLCSEWISPDNAKQAMMAWIDVVKSSIVGDAEAEREEQRAKVRRAKMETTPVSGDPLFRAEGGPKKEDGAVLRPDYDDYVRAEHTAEASTAANLDPVSLAQQRLAALAARIGAMRATMASLETSLEKDLKEQTQWAIILNSLTGAENV